MSSNQNAVHILFHEAVEVPSIERLIAAWNIHVSGDSRIELIGQGDTGQWEVPGINDEYEIGLAAHLPYVEMSWEGEESITFNQGVAEFATSITKRYSGAVVHLFSEDLDSYEGRVEHVYKYGFHILTGGGGEEPKTRLSTVEVIKFTLTVARKPLHDHDLWAEKAAHMIETGVIHPENINQFIGGL